MKTNSKINRAYLPDGWKVKCLGDIGVTYGGLSGKARKDFEKGNAWYIPFLSVIKGIFVDVVSLKKVKVSNQEKQTKVQQGDILFNGSSETPEEVGLCSLLATDKIPENVYLNSFCFGFRIKKDIKVQRLYLVYYLRDHKGRKIFYALAQGATRYNLSRQRFKRITVPMPTAQEQTAIAQVLSDVDTLLQTINKLITKKQQLKRATMQQLLTGKRRLAGFTDRWEEKRLGDITKIKTGNKNNKDKVSNGAYPFFVRSQIVERINEFSFDEEAILIPGEGKIGKTIHYINGKFDYHQRVYKISHFSPCIIGKFIYYYLSLNFNSDAIAQSVKATVDSLRLPTFKRFSVKIPKKSEQTAIAQVFSDMDREIEALKKKKTKYQQLKKAMMQQLLTGKIRLL